MSTRATQTTRSPGFLGPRRSRLCRSCRFFVLCHRITRFLEFPVSGPIRVNARTFGVWNSARPVSLSHPRLFLPAASKAIPTRPQKRSGVTVSSESKELLSGPAVVSPVSNRADVLCM